MQGNEGKSGKGDNRKKSGPPSELSSLDFSGAGDAWALAQCAEKVQVLEGGDALLAVAEEASMLFASGQDEEAAQVLEATLDGAVGDEAGEGLWLMLLDLHRLSGDRQRFDQRGATYAARFEKSPPQWEDLSTPTEEVVEDATPTVALNGSLSGQVEVQFGKLVEFARNNGGVKIDLGRLRSADDKGCKLLRDVVRELEQDRVPITLLNCATLGNMLLKQVSCGKPEKRDMWLMLFELLQRAGEFERFEQYAIDYAITFEESPPSWDPSLAPDADAALEVAASTSISSGRQADFHLDGEISSSQQEQVRALAAFASTRAMIDVDCSRLRRVDFASAGTLFNVLANLQAQGKLVTFKKVNNMVAALLRVMGVHQVAQLLPRR
ncbi:MAG: STAS domain-containing protein [Rhodocyclaceae bacterium]|nr:STAS domain-containing protein [Rhodocyclaceae bacterium]